MDSNCEKGNEMDTTLKKFKNRVTELVKDDIVRFDDLILLRFLKARDYNVAKAETMFKESWKWHCECNSKYILDDYELPEVGKYYSMHTTGFSKNGSVVTVSRQGLVDVKGLVNSSSTYDFDRFLFWKFARGKILSDERASKGLCTTYQVYMIFDFSGYEMKHNLSKSAIEYFLRCVKFTELNYPENLYKSVVINASRIFTILYNIVQPILSERTKSKVVLFGYNESEWREYLLKDIDENQLVEYLGGTITDDSGDPYCPSLIGPAGPIPTSYYRTKVDFQQENYEQVQTILCSAKFTTLINIEKANTLIEWSFQTADYDIAFAVYLCELGKTELAEGYYAERITKRRVECSKYIENGRLKCREAGTYIFEFDNSYSKLRSKTVGYTIKTIDCKS